MKRLVEAAVIVVVVIGGAWLAAVTSWLRRFNPVDFHE